MKHIACSLSSGMLTALATFALVASSAYGSQEGSTPAPGPGAPAAPATSATGSGSAAGSKTGTATAGAPKPAAPAPKSASPAGNEAAPSVMGPYIPGVHIPVPPGSPFEHFDPRVGVVGGAYTGPLYPGGYYPFTASSTVPAYPVYSSETVLPGGYPPWDIHPPWDTNRPIPPGYLWCRQ
jgi:hypothetical protein